MLMLLMTNVQSIVVIMIANYAYIKLNLEQLNSLEEAYKDCLNTRSTYNNMEYKFEDDHFSLANFCVYKPIKDKSENMGLFTIFDNVTLDLPLNRIYKLSGDSGIGKTTFLKAVTNNWQYTDGSVKFPGTAKNNIFFIPQDTFIPTGTLLEILTYPLKPKEFLINDSKSKLLDNSEMVIEEVNKKLINNIVLNHKGKNISKLIDQAKYLLAKVKLFPDITGENEIETEIIRAVLANSNFLIMDESTSALDLENREIVYEMIKEYISELEPFLVIYTEHSTTEGFADTILTITNKDLEHIVPL
jgi:ABC-type uncharacterized transport system fused permease/ATPase subunit